MSDVRVAHERQVMVFPYDRTRNISSGEDERNNRKIYVGQAPITAIVDLPTNENVRDYIPEAEGRVRRVYSQVHRAIRDCVERIPEDFSVLNSGIVVVARACEMNAKNKTLELVEPSIINGSQTQGVIRDFLKDIRGAENLQNDIHIKFEIIVTDDEGIIAETSIARNFQNDVMTISIVGRRGMLNELQESLQKKSPGAKLKMSETQLSDDYVDTERLIQVIAALVPEQLWARSSEFNKVYTYSQKARCLKDFQQIHKEATDPTAPNHERYRDLYQFYLDVPAQALQLYDKWRLIRALSARGFDRSNGTIKAVAFWKFRTASFFRFLLRYPPSPSKGGTVGRSILQTSSTMMS